ncbi:MAG: protein YgfX [Gammaproteobacteria bacterium]|nr:protein YgfX [Gammaproteobacteria bacterium]
MSSTKSAPPLRLSPKPSRILIALLTVGHLGAIAILLPLDIHLIIKLGIAIVLAVSLVIAVRKQPGRTGEGGVQTLIWQADGDWLLETADGETLDARLHESTYVHPWLVVLNFRLTDRPGLLSFTLAPDALDKETFRALRVRLKVEGDSQQ